MSAHWTQPEILRNVQLQCNTTAGLGLAEVWRLGMGEVTTDEGHKLWFSGETKECRNGVGFFVYKTTVGNVLHCEYILSRIISIWLNASPFKLTVIQVYAATSDHTDVEIRGLLPDSHQNYPEHPAERRPDRSRQLERQDWYWRPRELASCHRKIWARWDERSRNALSGIRRNERFRDRKYPTSPQEITPLHVDIPRRLHYKPNWLYPHPEKIQVQRYRKQN